MNQHVAVEDLVAALSRRLGAHLALQEQILNGEEAEVWAASAGAERYVVHVITSPWRSADELSWCHRVAITAAATVPEVVTPLLCDGESVLEWNGQLVTVFPFVEGTTLDRDDPVQVRQAARLLARIHRALRSWTGGQAPRSLPHSNEADAVLDDPDLDQRWQAQTSRLRPGVCHGDYYRRNLLVADGTIRGVIDWHDAYVGPLIGEVAWAAWEFGHDEEMNLVRDRFDLFVDEYRGASGGHVPEWEYELVPTAARVMVRGNVRSALTCGSSMSDEYLQRQARAFWELEALLAQ